METLLLQIAAALGARRQTLATAESCTGGLVGAALTGLPGSSAWYRGGVIAYANELKLRLLGVPPDVLAAHGAVSLETARAMAEGARAATGADFAVAITGIAGPAGGTPEKPVGLVYIGVAAPHGTATFKHRFSGSRADVRHAAAETALRHLWEQIRLGEDASPYPKS
ncbi:MAG: CinA family protein [Kiritimatiellia bacterium]